MRSGFFRLLLSCRKLFFGRGDFCLGVFDLAEGIIDDFLILFVFLIRQLFGICQRFLRCCDFIKTVLNLLFTVCDFLFRIGCFGIELLQSIQIFLHAVFIFFFGISFQSAVADILLCI